MRKFAIKKCAMVARRQGFPAFALENGGQCLGGKNILAMYNMYGPSGACRVDGKGGPWSMEVFKFKRKVIFLRFLFLYKNKILYLLFLFLFLLLLLLLLLLF